MTTETSLTYGGSAVKSCRRFPAEDWRTKYRVEKANAVLRSMGVEPTFEEHAEDCARMVLVLGQNRADQPCTCGVGREPKPTWPEWVTDKMFNLAYELADEVQTEQGAHGRASADALKAGR